MNRSKADMDSEAKLRARHIAMLTPAQNALLAKCTKQWTRMEVGCTNGTLQALISRRLVEHRWVDPPGKAYHVWEWRLAP